MAVLILGGKPFYAVASIVMAIASLAVIIASAMAISSSYGYYVGGIYSGIFTLILSFLTFQPEKSGHIYVLLISIFLALVVNLVALILTGKSAHFVDSLAACGSYDDEKSTSCGSSSYYQCYGDDSYYSQAVACEASYIADHDEISENQCACVTDSDSDTCYDYYNMSDCGKFLDDTPGALYASMAFLVGTLIVVGLLFIVTMINYCKPQLLMSKEQREDFERLNAPIVSTTAVAEYANTNYVTATPVK